MVFVTLICESEDNCDAAKPPNLLLHSHAVNGDWPLKTKLPLVGGHEGAGVVVAVGELVKDVEVGEHAGVKVEMTPLPSFGSS